MLPYLATIYQDHLRRYIPPLRSCVGRPKKMAVARLGRVSGALALEGSSDSSDFDEVVKLEIPIHNVNAKVYLNCKMEEVVPEAFAEHARHIASTIKIPWIFRSWQQDGRQNDLRRWPSSNSRFRLMFRDLKKAPDFDKGMYQGGTVFDREKVMRMKFPLAQADALIEFLSEILDILNYKQEMDAGFFRLFVEHMNWNMGYITKGGDRHYDAPVGIGCIGITYVPPSLKARPIIPLVITRKSESLESAIAGQVKMMLSELYINLHRLNDFGDKMRDQETYLIAMHGSRMHILRAWIPGLKSSALWSQKRDLIIRRSIYPDHTPETLLDQNARATAYKEAIKCAMKDILTDLGGEVRVDTFRVVASKEYDLWIKQDFQDAVQVVVALFTYLMSGQAKVGILQDAFRWDRYEYDSSDDDLTAMSPEDDEELGASGTTLTAEGVSLTLSNHDVQTTPSRETPLSPPSPGEEVFLGSPIPAQSLSPSREPTPGTSDADDDKDADAESASSKDTSDIDNFLNSHWLHDIMREFGNPNDVEDETNFNVN